MGREIHLMRLALGRSNLEPPEDSETFTASRASNWSSAVHRAGESVIPEQSSEEQRQNLMAHDVPMYDGRGHPFNPVSRARGRQLRDAQNEILSVVGVTERKHSIETSKSLESSLSVNSDEEVTGKMMGYIAEFDHQLYSWWIHSFTNRSLVFPPLSDMPFVDLFTLHWTILGWPDFLFAGLPSFMVSRLIGPDTWTQSAVYALDRVVMACVSSRGGRKLYDRARPVVTGTIYVLMNILLPPLQLHSMLQVLGFRPEHSLLGLPKLHSWIPFCGTSNSRWNWEVLPFLAFQPLLSVTRAHLSRTCHAIMLGPSVGPSGNPRHGDSHFEDKSWKAEQIASRVLSRAFQFLQWLPRSSIATPSSNLVLRRSETWNLNDEENRTEFARPVESHTPIEAGPPPLGSNEASLVPSAPSSPQLQRVQTTATIEHNSTLDAERDNASDATIRVSSIDSVSGAVNLEIGLPEEVVLAGVEASLNESQDTGPTRRASEVDALTSTHHRSKLAVEPARLLADVSSQWLADLLLMPVKAMVLRRLVGFVMLRPEVFGVDPARARMLPYLFGSSAQAVHQGSSSLAYLGHLGLCTAFDASLGLSFWLLDWSIIRFYGVNAFGWGTF